MNNLNGLNQPKIRWSRIPSRPINDRPFFETETEGKLYELISKIGVISGGQIQAHRILHKSPKTTRKILSRLKAARKLVEHVLSVGNKDYKIYTLGPGGAETIKVPYQNDYWFSFSPDEVIQRIMTLELYARLSDYLSTEIIVERADSPYIFKFNCGDKSYMIGIAWDNAINFTETYRWSKPQERVIIVCQDIAQLNCLLCYMDEHTPVRAVTKEKIKEGLVLYRPEGGKWVLDVPNRQIKQKLNEEKVKVIQHKRILL